MILFNAIVEGLKKSYRLCLKLSKIIIPVFFIVQILKYSGILQIIASYTEGFMKVFGLPGDAALALILANTINIYGSFAVIESIELTIREITILGLMIGISHSLPVETSIIKELKVPRYLQMTLRMGLAIIVGIMVNLVWR